MDENVREFRRRMILPTVMTAVVVLLLVLASISVIPWAVAIIVLALFVVIITMMEARARFNMDFAIWPTAGILGFIAICVVIAFVIAPRYW